MDGSIDRNGRSVAWRDWGGSGRDIVLFHGGGGNLATWTALGPQLAELGHVVGYDQAGNGRSDDPPPGEEFDHLGDALVVLEATTEERPLLVGHSFGAAVALHLAVDGHAAALLLLDGGPSIRHFEPAPPPDPETTRQRMEAMGFGRRCTPPDLEEFLQLLPPRPRRRAPVRPRRGRGRSPRATPHPRLRPPPRRNKARDPTTPSSTSTSTAESTYRPSPSTRRTAPAPTSAIGSTTSSVPTSSSNRTGWKRATASTGTNPKPWSKRSASW